MNATFATTSFIASTWSLMKRETPSTAKNAEQKTPRIVKILYYWGMEKVEEAFNVNVMPA